MTMYGEVKTQNHRRGRERMEHVYLLYKDSSGFLQVILRGGINTV